MVLSIRDPRLVCTIAVIWSVIIVALYASFRESDKDSPLLWNWGPSDRLNFLGVRIHTWTRWILLNSIVTLDTAVNVWILEVVHTWVTLNIYSSRKDHNFSNRTTLLIAIALNLYTTLHTIVSVFLALTQLDTQVLIIVENLVLTCMIVRTYLTNQDNQNIDLYSQV